MEKKIIRVYVAGPLTPRGNKNPAIGYLDNIRRMFRIGVELMLAGYEPFIPACDLMMFLQLRGTEEISEERIKDYSIAWLKACDAVVLVPGWESSPGTKAELSVAKALDIPVYESVYDLKRRGYEVI